MNNLDQHIPLAINQFDYNIEGDDLFLVIDSLIDSKGLISHHLDSANDLYSKGIHQIITQGFKIEKDIPNKRIITDEDKSIDHTFCEVIFTDVQLNPPSTFNFNTNKESILYPKVALAREKIYSGSLYISCNIRAVAYKKDGSTVERTDSVKLFRICKMPIIKGSIMCNTYGKSKEALLQMEEDPSDTGGYFIVKGEWAVDCTENITYNQPKIYINEGYDKSRVRCEFISKPGDTYQNSDYTLIRYNNDETITVEIARDRLNEKQIPFYLIFRAFGWTSDKDMFDHIVYDYDDDVNKKVFNSVLLSLNSTKYVKGKDTANFKSIHDQTEALKQIVKIAIDNYKHMELETKPENYHNAITDVLRIFDTYCFPHIGMTSASRHEKLKHLALLIRKTILVYMGYIPQTDRDSFCNKRIHAGGVNYAKAIKTYVNQAVMMPIKRKIVKDFNSAPFSTVNLSSIIKSSVYADDFERIIVQTIVSGNKSNLKIKKRNIVNRLATQLLNRKNQLNVFATMRQITAPSADSAKQSERASEMRRVHMSALGYICVNHSPPEGEKVGINKQMAISATIAPSSSSEVLKKILSNDKIIIPEKNLEPVVIFRNNYGRVYVNGKLIGYVEDSLSLVEKYRRQRREMKIHTHTTIFWDNIQNEVQFFVDVGRLTRPLIIVYNNRRDKEVNITNSNNIKLKKKVGDFSKSDTFDNDEYKYNNFEQGIGITSEDIRLLYQKKKTIDDLVREQKVEFITPEEQTNCFICPSFNDLVRNRYNELKPFTHCDIPQAILGITALTAPFGNHNQAPRVTYQTSQAKQTCGYYSLNWPFRMDKETFLQYVNEMPLIRTSVNKYIFPNGNNIMLAMMCYGGGNQEDECKSSQLL